MEEVSFGIYIPSYKRANLCITHRWLEYYRYVVRKSEEQAYLDAGIAPENLLAVQDDLIDGMVKVNQWLIDNAEEDIICILDDDIRRMVYRLDKAEDMPGPETVTAELERVAQTMIDLRIGFGAVDATVTPWNYDAEFGFRGCAGAVRWINRMVFKARCVPELEYNYDLDLVLQELMFNRIILKPKYICAMDVADKTEGGASDKSRSDQIASVELMKAKWGKYFGYNFRSNKPTINVRR